MDTAIWTWEVDTKVKAVGDKGKVPAGVVTDAVKSGTKLMPLTVSVEAVFENIENGKMEEMTGTETGGGGSSAGDGAGGGAAVSVEVSS